MNDIHSGAGGRKWGDEEEEQRSPQQQKTRKEKKKKKKSKKAKKLNIIGILLGIIMFVGLIALNVYLMYRAASQGGFPTY